MKRFKNILLYADKKADVRESLGLAEFIARNNDARLTVADVISEELDYYSQMMSVYRKTLHLKDMVFKDRIAELGHIIGPLKNKGLKVSANVFVGTPFLEIIKEVIRGKYDLLIVTAEGKSEFKDMLFGTTTMHFMRKCPCPVWALKPGEQTRFKRILAAVDPDPSQEENRKLNTKILGLASSLAILQKSELHVLHAWHVPGRYLDFLRNDLEKITGEAQNMHRSWLDSLLKKHFIPIQESQTHLIRGDPGIEIPRYANEKGIDLIVMGTVSRTGISGLLMGNTAEKILFRVDCAVMAVKPEGFDSPVSVD
jgi:nucleotide-binding universal stress UspA family protein